MSPVEADFDRVLDVIGLGVSGGLRLVHNGRLQPPPEVRKAWEQHGQHDSYSTVSDIRAIADELLPGATVTRHLLWRYTLIYQKRNKATDSFASKVDQARLFGPTSATKRHKRHKKSAKRICAFCASSWHKDF